MQTGLKIVIIGAGYAGLATVIHLRKRLPNAHITVIDQHAAHTIITRLHHTAQHPLADIQLPLQELATRFDFTFVQHAVSFEAPQLLAWQHSKCLQLDDKTIEFDYLVVATGAPLGAHAKASNGYDLAGLSQHCLATLLKKLIAQSTNTALVLNIIGAGPTGIQFAFAIEQVLTRCHIAYQLNLFDGQAQLLDAFPATMVRYVEQRLAEKKITVFPRHYFKGEQGTDLVFDDKASNSITMQRSDLSLFFLGKKDVSPLQANSSGQVLSGGQVLTRVFTAGDCSHYVDLGANAMTSQNALRKGKAVARNILREAGLVHFCLPYMHQEVGYILSLGTDDAVGWIGNKNIIVQGLPAMMAKEMIEAQYDLLLKGIDCSLF